MKGEFRNTIVNDLPNFSFSLHLSSYNQFSYLPVLQPQRIVYIVPSRR